LRRHRAGGRRHRRQRRQPAQGALIAAGSVGVYVESAAGAVTNFGTINARYPVLMNHGGAVTNG
jgi:hypothetical protein